MSVDTRYYATDHDERQDVVKISALMQRHGDVAVIDVVGGYADARAITPCQDDVVSTIRYAAKH